MSERRIGERAYPYIGAVLCGKSVAHEACMALFVCIYDYPVAAGPQQGYEYAEAFADYGCGFARSISPFLDVDSQRQVRLETVYGFEEIYALESTVSVETE